MEEKASYTPPGGTSYTWSYDQDRRPIQKTLPGGRDIVSTFDTGSRPTGLSYAEAAVTYAYGAGDLTERVGRIIKTPVGGTGSQELAFTYDGELVEGLEWTGLAQGQYSYTYDQNFLLSGLNFISGSDSASIAFTYDNDGLISQYGPFSFGRGTSCGTLTQITDGTLNMAYAYNTFGELASRVHSVNGQEVYRIELSYDLGGRVVQKVETAGGTPVTSTYTYDADGQLTGMERTGSVEESYGYDGNGNRTLRGVGGITEAASYDGQDRLTQLGSKTYQFNQDGFLMGRGSDTFQYSARGELLEAVVGRSDDLVRI